MVLPSNVTREFLGARGQSTALRRPLHSRVGKRVHLGPNALHLAHEDIGSRFANALELLKQTTFSFRVSLSGLSEPSQVAAVFGQQFLGIFAEPRGCAFVEALVAVGRACELRRSRHRTGRHHHHGYVGGPRDSFRNAAQHGTTEAGAPMCSYDDQIRARSGRLGVDDLGRRSTEWHDLGVRRDGLLVTSSQHLSESGMDGLELLGAGGHGGPRCRNIDARPDPRRVGSSEYMQ